MVAMPGRTKFPTQRFYRAVDLPECPKVVLLWSKYGQVMTHCHDFGGQLLESRRPGIRTLLLQSLGSQTVEGCCGTWADAHVLDF